MPSIQEQFNTLLLSTELAARLSGIRPPGEISYEESEQGYARRRLLHIEKLAAEQKASEAKAHAETIQAVSNSLHNKVIDELVPLFSNSVTISVSTLGLSKDIVLLLDTLSTKACSVSLLEPIVMRLPWLHEAILKDLNSPENRRIDGRGEPIIVESIRTALSTIGIDNLQFLLPYLIIRYCVPQITDPFPDLKTRLAEYSLGLANAMYRVAQKLELKAYDAYILGMLSNLGMCASSKLYFKQFDLTLREYSQEAMDNKDQTTYQALQLVEPSPSHLNRLYSAHSTELTSRAFEYMPFKRVSLIQPWGDPEHPLHEALVLAKRFTILKMLIRYRLIDKDEAKSHLAKLNIPTHLLEVLNQPGLFKLAFDY